MHRYHISEAAAADTVPTLDYNGLSSGKTRSVSTPWRSREVPVPIRCDIVAVSAPVSVWSLRRYGMSCQVLPVHVFRRRTAAGPVEGTPPGKVSASGRWEVLYLGLLGM